MFLLSQFVLVYHLVISQASSTADLNDIIKEIAPELVDKLTKTVFDVIHNNTHDGRRDMQNKRTSTVNDIYTRQFIIVDEKRIDFETLVDMVKEKLNRKNQILPRTTRTTEMIFGIPESQHKIGLVNFKVTSSNANYKAISFELTTTKETKEDETEMDKTATRRFPKKSNRREVYSKYSNSKENVESWMINRNKRFKIVTKDNNKPLNDNNHLNNFKKSYTSLADDEIKNTYSVSKVRDLLKSMSEENKGWGRMEKTTSNYFSEEVYSDEFSIKTIASSEIKAETKQLDVDEFIDDDTERNSAEVSLKTTEMLRKDWYKAHTPDYIKKTTAAVEKYNFNEPIPEKDRIRSSLESLSDYA